MDLVLAAARLFEQEFVLIPDPVTIMIVPAVATIGGLLGAFGSIVVSRGSATPAGPSLRGALLGAWVGLLYLLVGLVQ